VILNLEQRLSSRHGQVQFSSSSSFSPAAHALTHPRTHSPIFVFLPHCRSFLTWTSRQDLGRTGPGFTYCILQKKTCLPPHCIMIVKTLNLKFYTLIERNPSSKGGFLCTVFPHQEPCVRGPPSKNLVQILQLQTTMRALCHSRLPCRPCLTTLSNTATVAGRDPSPGDPALAVSRPR